MNISSLRHRITFQRLSDTDQDAYGESEEWWIDHYSCWAEIRPLRSAEKQAADQTMTTASHEFTIRYKAGLLLSDRITYDGRVFSITSIINPYEQKRVLKITAAEAILDAA